MDGYAAATLVIFFVSMAFVIHPVTFRVRSIPISIDLTTAPIFAIGALWAAQCIDGTVIRNGIVGTGAIKPYNIIIFFFSFAYMAITLDISGIFVAAACWVTTRGGDKGWKIYLYFYILLTFVSILLGNDPVILSGTAFLAYYTNAARLDPIPWMMAGFAAANTASMVLFVGNPTNVIICEGFGVNDAAFTAYMILPFVACNILCFFVLALQYRKEVPRKLDNPPAQRSPREALKDPAAAAVGSVLLLSALIVRLVISVIGLDVWRIGLPFAVAKFLFDLGWGYFKTTYGVGSVEQDVETGKTSPAASTSEGRSPTGDTCQKMVSLPDTLDTQTSSFLSRQRSRLVQWHHWSRVHFETVFTALARLPFGFAPFAFSQFILVEALAHQNWVNVFANWLVRATHGGEMYSTIWLVGLMGVVMCNILGTNIGATILLTAVVRAAALPAASNRVAAIALAVASNIGAVSFTFSASLAGLLWKRMLDDKEIRDKRGNLLRQRDFALMNCLPLVTMTVAGLAVVSAEMAVLYPPQGR